MNSCSSSISLQKSAKSEDVRSKSCDTVCTSNSSCTLQKIRKPPNPLMYSLRPSYSRTSSNSVRQRVLSAKLLKLRSIQNQLNDANYHLSELAKENQILQSLQKRQDKALSKYESTNADLPRLIRSHEEQLRVLNEKIKSQRKSMKEINDLLKSKEEELAKTQEKLTHLEKLNRDKRLLDREKLVDQVEDLKIKLQKSDEQVAILNRKLMLESKTAKQRLNGEMAKHKQCQRELGQALAEIDRLTGLLEAKENVVHPKKNRFLKNGQLQSVSMIALNSYSNRIKSGDRLATIVDSELSTSRTPITDIKLEPIKCKTEEPSKKSNGILNMPSENIRNRLSSASSKSKGSSENLFGNGLTSSGSEQSLNNQEYLNDLNELKYESDFKKSFDSDTQLGKLLKPLDDAIDVATEHANENFDENLADYCSKITSNVLGCSKRLEKHKDSLKLYQQDTDTLLESFKKTEHLESKLLNSMIASDKKDDLDFFNELFSDDIKVRLRKDNNENFDNVSKKGPKVNLEDRKKLLATLKAIDNGDSIDSIHDNSTNLMQEVSQ